ncbi:MAG: ATP-binding protein [Bacteroidales bacterium]
MDFLKTFLILFLTTSRLIIFAQGIDSVETLYVTPFGVDEGLRQSMVRRVIQDQSGLIWMTTGDGLHCFDGTAFRAFRVPVNPGYTHSGNIMRNVVEPAPGTFILSSSSSLLQFSKADGQFKTILYKEGSFPVLLDQLLDRKPAVWLHDKKLCLVANDRLYPQKLVIDNGFELPVAFFPKHSLSIGAKELMISDETGILLLNTGSRVAGSAFRAKWMPVEACQAIAANRKGEVFVLAGGIICRYKGDGRMEKIFDTRLGRGEMNLFADSRDNFWVTVKLTGKPFIYAKGKLKELKMVVSSGKHTDITTPDIISLFEDDHNNIWMGTDNDGVLLYSPGKRQLLRTGIGFIRCMAWFDHALWAGTYKEGLWRISPDLSLARKVSHEHDKNNYYLDMKPDHRGRLWIVTQQGVEVVDHEGKTLFYHPYGCVNAKLVAGAGDTLMLFSEDRVSRFFSGEKPALIDAAGFVNTTTFLHTGEYNWTGNQFGLFRWKKNLGFDKNSCFVKSNRLSEAATNSLMVHEGAVWAATGNGIEIFDLSGNRKPLPGKIKELQNEVLYAMQSDDLGRIWFSGNHGLGCINAAKDRIFYFSRHDNLQSMEFNQNAACRAPDGRLYFGGIMGINGFDPAWFSSGEKVAAPRLMSLSVADTSFTRGIPSGLPELILSRHAPHVGGKVFCPDYSRTGSQLFSFYLEGYQLAWSAPSQSAEFSYRDLPPGSYRLIVKFGDSWQNWSDPVTLLSITLRQPFWKTGWFLIILIVFITTVTAYLARKINSMRFTRRILVLEQQNAIEKERLRISKDMHDDLGASLTRISILSELAKKQQDDPLKSQQLIGQISDISGGVVDDLSEIIWAMNPRNDTFDSFSSHIREYASSYLESAGIEGHFRFPQEIPAIGMPSDLRRNIFLVVKEALNNIVKHAGANKVQMEMYLRDETLGISITDNGKGFEADQNPHRGNGLVNMHKRMEEHNGAYAITSGEGRGTTIELSVKLPEIAKSH